MLVRSAAGVLAWCAYSAIQRWHLSRGTFAAMQLLAETRDPDGDHSLVVLPLIERLRPANCVPDGWVYLAGTCGDDKEVIERCDECTTVRATKDVVCRLSDDGASFGLFGRPTVIESKLPSLREMVGSHTIKPKIYESISDRLNWMRNIDERCVPVVDANNDSNASSSCADVLEGSYSFCFRDYVNHEELLAMMCRRCGVDNLLVRPTRTGRLIVEDHGKIVKLNERGIAFGFLPIRIDWEGHVEEDLGEVVWDTTSFRCGWKRLGRTFDKPKAAEELRTDPWVIYLPTDDGNGGGDSSSSNKNSGDIVVFRKKGSGMLVYARDECLGK